MKIRIRPTRTRFQNGTLYQRPRANGPDVWEYRWRVRVSPGKYERKSAIVGTIEDLPTESAARKEASGYRLIANPDHVHKHVTFGAIVQRYLAEELPDRRSTGTHYKPWIKNHIKTKWSDYPIESIKPFAVELWLKGLQLSLKSKGHIRSLMSIMFDCAMRWELIELAVNPMEKVRIKNDRPQRVVVRYKLTAPQFGLLLAELQEPFRTMAVLAACLGLRSAEIAGLQWEDIDWNEHAVYIRRTFTLGAADEVKTRKSKKRMPLCDRLAEVLREHQKRIDVCSPWIFANPDTGLPRSMNYSQQEYLRPAGKAAGIGDGLGWHSLRHTYSTWLRKLKIDIKVQQEMLRHADIRTTMNIYTDAPADALQEAGEAVAGMALVGS